MSETVYKFIDEIVALSPCLREVYAEAIQYWTPQKPPVTVILGEFGNRIVDDFNSTDNEKTKEIFLLIESGLNTGDVNLETAVATGLVEAIAGRSDDLGIWSDVFPMFGKLSAEHASAWMSF